MGTVDLCMFIKEEMPRGIPENISAHVNGCQWDVVRTTFAV